MQSTTEHEAVAGGEGGERHCKELLHCCFAAGKQFLKQTKYVNNANK